MHPGKFITFIFALLALSALALGGGALYWLLATKALPDPRLAAIAGVAGLLLYCAVLLVGWVLVQLRLVRPLDALAREVETLSHARKLRPMELPENGLTGGLAHAVQDLVERFIAAREKTSEAIEEATERTNIYKR
ncbi:MAG: hypothetical protein D6773_08035, partial [Alphaproteobacteria bacterium]